MPTVKLLLADSNQLIRLGLKSVFSDSQLFNIVEEAESNEDLLSKAATTDAQVALIDYTSPGFTIDVIPQVREKNKNIQFVAITYDQSGFTIVNAIKSGVTSYIKKDCDVQEIKDAVTETAAGSKFFCGKILETIQKEAIEVQNIEVEAMSCAPITLTQREQEILKLLRLGLSNQAISEQTGVALSTIKWHLKKIFAKLGVSTRAEAIVHSDALESGVRIR